MAYPTQVTIASGKTIYRGDEGDGITSRQVQVSVTYQLERADDDLLLAVERKAREVEAAQAAVWRQVNKEQAELPMDGTDLPKSPPHPTDEDDPLGGSPEEDPDEDWPDDGGADNEEDDHGGDHEGGIAPAHYPAVPPQGLHACRAGNGHGSHGPGAAGRVPLGIRKPQRLAIEAQARRLGLSDVALAETIRERFGKASFTPRFAVDRLSKAEAATLLLALQALGRGEDTQAQAPAGPPAAGLTRH